MCILANDKRNSAEEQFEKKTENKFSSEWSFCGTERQRWGEESISGGHLG
jgi:hypothetical protein